MKSWRCAKRWNRDRRSKGDRKWIRKLKGLAWQEDRRRSAERIFRLLSRTACKNDWQTGWDKINWGYNKGRQMFVYWNQGITWIRIVGTRMLSCFVNGESEDIRVTCWGKCKCLLGEEYICKQSAMCSRRKKKRNIFRWIKRIKSFRCHSIEEDREIERERGRSC